MKGDHEHLTQKGLVKHYERIAQNTNLPIILYNVPSRTGVNVEPETCLELSKIKNIVGIKEASGNLSQVAKIAALCGKEFYIYSGNDDQILPVLSVGGVGVISVLANIKPEFVHNMITEYKKGNIENATQMQIKSLELINLLFSEVNPIPVKTALEMIGFNFGEPRLPLIKMTDENKDKLKNIINMW